MRQVGLTANCARAAVMLYFDAKDKAELVEVKVETTDEPAASGETAGSPEGSIPVD